MSRQLIESIVSNNMLEANDMVEAKLAEIRERKMYEMKRMFAAKMDEGLGGKSVKQLADLGFKPAHKVLGLHPYDKGREEAKKKHADIKASAEKKTENEKTAGAAKAAKAAKAAAGGIKKGLSAVANSRLGQKIAAHEPEAPGSKVLRATKRLANSQITHDVKDIAFRNI